MSTTFKKVVDSGVKEVTSGYLHSALLNDKGELCVTGNNHNFGMLGTGDTTQVNGFDKKCFPRPGGCNDNNGGCHSKRTCTVEAGSVKCGDCAAPLTNDGPKGCKAPPACPTIKAFPSAIVNSFDHHTVVVGDDGNLYGTGLNSQGELGDGTKNNAKNFKIILRDVKTATGGESHIAALKQDGSVWAAGWNKRGQLGDGSATTRHKFVKVIDKDVVHVSAGVQHTVVIKQDCSLWATGYNAHGQLGDG